MITFGFSSRATAEFLHENSTVDFATVHYINDPSLIVKHPPMVLFNAAPEFDLRGQSVAETTGARE